MLWQCPTGIRLGNGMWRKSLVSPFFRVCSVPYLFIICDVQGMRDIRQLTLPPRRSKIRFVPPSEGEAGNHKIFELGVGYLPPRSPLPLLMHVPRELGMDLLNPGFRQVQRSRFQHLSIDRSLAPGWLLPPINVRTLLLKMRQQPG